jgi:hypothetical protein
VQTTKSQGCWLPAEGVRRAASRTWSSCSGAIATSASGSRSCATATAVFDGPFSSNETLTRVDPFSQSKRAVRPGCEVRSDIVPSVSQLFRCRRSTNAAKTASTGTAIVLETQTVNPSACWCLSRIPRERS